MKTAVIITAKRGAAPSAAGPLPAGEAALSYKKIVAAGGQGLDSIELWYSSNGRVKRKFFKADPIKDVDIDEPAAETTKPKKPKKTNTS